MRYNRSEFAAHAALVAMRHPTPAAPEPVAIAFRDTRTATQRHAEFYYARGIVKGARRYRDFNDSLAQPRGILVRLAGMFGGLK